ncbi:acyltransferase family protein [Patulibacter minatonensis]|uniref:acyltransferase family protein n=1 Tax=Patulibacter minatonensis TaxID=298163 RepID=UPI00047C267F|nr:acyltransferase [Patulibacter minatonensis]
MSAPAQSSVPHLSALDGLRGVAALGVAVAHVWRFVRGDGAAPDGRLLNGLIGEGRIGMPLFFVLSGYLIFRPFAAAALDGRAQPRLWPYALRRGARIIPAYWLVILLALLALSVLAHPAARPVTDLPAFLLFLQNYSPGTHGAIDAPTWSVTIEVSFYVVVPLLGLLAATTAGRLRSAVARRRVLGAACLVLMVVGSYLIGQGTLHGWDPTVTDTLPVRMGSFAAGMLVAVLAHDRRIPTGRATAMAAVGLVLIVGEVAARIYELGPASARELLIDTPITIGFALIIGAIATGRPTGAVVMERGPLFRLGAPSYGLYLVHYPVIQVLRSLDAFPKDPLLAVVVVIGISIALAVVSWRFVESPVIDWAHRRMPSRRVPRPAIARASGD